jgi:hypothetical protein
MNWLKKLLNVKKVRELVKGITLASVLIASKMLLIAGAQVNVQPTAPPNVSPLTTVLGYLQWLGIVGGVGVGALLAGIKMALLHDMEGAKRDLIYSVVGGIIVSLVSTIINLFI